MVTKTRPYIVPPEMPRIGYGVLSVGERAGYKGKGLEIAVAMNGTSTVGTVARHVKGVLESLYPQLTVGIEELQGIAALSVVGYDTEEARVDVRVRRGIEPQTVFVEPVLGRDGFVGKYKAVLERDKIA